MPRHARDPRNARRRWFLGAAAAAVASPAIPRAQEPLVLWGPPAGPSVTLAHAVATGALDALGPVAFRAWRDPDELRAGLASGQMALFALPVPAASALRARGLGVALVNVMTDGLLHVLAEDPGLDRIEALRGKRLAAIFRNDLPDHILRVLIDRAGLPPDAVEIVFAGAPVEAAQLLLAGRVDAAFLSEPAASAALLKAGAAGRDLRRVIDAQAEWGRLTGLAPSIPQAGLGVSAAFLARAPQSVAAVQAALAASAAAVVADPAGAARLVAPLLALPEPVLAAAIPMSRLTATPARQARAAIDAMLGAIAARDPKAIGGRMPDDGFYL
jgi:NitT/TauT family transport system substrate-binding protein